MLQAHDGNKLLFTSLVQCNEGKATFGDGSTAKICGKGIKTCASMPTFENILYIASLKVNLIRISQLYNKSYKIDFSKEMCMLFDKMVRL